MEDLEVNPLYKAFLSPYRREFEIACKMSAIIAIPHSDSLESYEIDQYFANSHILVPSKLLRMHFTTLQVGYFEDIEIDNNKLICYLGKNRPIDKIEAKILAEEIGYNSHNKEYKTIIIDRPLLSFSYRPLFKTFLLPMFLSSVWTDSARRSQIKRVLRTRLEHHDDCFKYLECISQQLTLQFEEDIKRLQSNYIFLSHYIDDAANRIKQLVENYVPKFELILAGEQESLNIKLCPETIERGIRISVETYLVHLLHGKLIVALQNLYEQQDNILLNKFDLINLDGLTICQLGAQDVFSEFQVNDKLLIELRLLPELQSPLAILSTLMRCVELISEILNQSVRFKRLLGLIDSDRNTCSNISICSDDLIASFVYSLARARPRNLFSVIKYLEIFGWSSAAKDQAAYYTATFQIVIEYISNYRPTSSSDKTRARLIENDQIIVGDNDICPLRDLIAAWSLLDIELKAHSSVRCAFINNKGYTLLIMDTPRIRMLEKQLSLAEARLEFIKKVARVYPLFMMWFNGPFLFFRYAIWVLLIGILILIVGVFLYYRAIVDETNPVNLVPMLMNYIVSNPVMFSSMLYGVDLLFLFDSKNINIVCIGLVMNIVGIIMLFVPFIIKRKEIDALFWAIQIEKWNQEIRIQNKKKGSLPPRMQKMLSNL